MRDGSRARASTLHLPMVKEDIFFLPGTAARRGSVCLQLFFSSLIGQTGSGSAFRFPSADAARTAELPSSAQPVLAIPESNKANHPHAVHPDCKTSAITMVATAGNQSFLGYRIDKGVPGELSVPNDAHFSPPDSRKVH